MVKAATLVMFLLSAPARKPTVWIHAPSQPLMQSLLSQFQTPTAPRRISRFFRVWLLFRLPCRANHSAYFGRASFISPILSAVDVSQTKQLLQRCQRNSQHNHEISVNVIVENEAVEPARLRNNRVLKTFSSGGISTTAEASFLRFRRNPSTSNPSAPDRVNYRTFCTSVPRSTIPHFTFGANTLLP